MYSNSIACIAAMFMAILTATPLALGGDGGDDIGRCCYVETCAADIADANNICGGDGVVDTFDLLRLLEAWGAADACADIVEDGVVDTFDLLGLLEGWSCSTEASCVMLNESQCDALVRLSDGPGGGWNPEADCANDPCVLGSCCFVQAVAVGCVETFQSDCITIYNGVWQANARCADAPCPIGRCCLPDGVNCLDTLEMECDILGGAFDAELDCTNDACPPPPTGRCCYFDGAEQCVVSIEFDCVNALNGIWDAGIDCTEPCPFGRCCIPSFDNGTMCAEMSSAACAGAGGVFAEGLNCMFQPCADLPPNNSCIGSIIFSYADPSSTPFDLTGARSTGLVETDCMFTNGDVGGDQDLHKDIWFRITGTMQSGTLYIDTCGAGAFDTRIALYSGIFCPGSFKEPVIVACSESDQNGCGQPVEASLTAPVKAGDSFYLRIGTSSIYATTGPDVLNVEFIAD